jgi:hypothetical protein
VLSCKSQCQAIAFPIQGAHSCMTPMAFPSWRWCQVRGISAGIDPVVPSKTPLKGASR